MNEEWNLGILRIHEGENADLDLFKEKENSNVDGLRIGIIILEIKAATNLNDEHRAQVHNYSKDTLQSRAPGQLWPLFKGRTPTNNSLIDRTEPL